MVALLQKANAREEAVTLTTAASGGYGDVRLAQADIGRLGVRSEVLNEAGDWASAWGDALVSPGYGVFPAMVSPELCLRLNESLVARRDENAFARGRTGRGEGLDWRPELRTDEIYWLNDQSATLAEADWLERMETVRKLLREQLRIPLDHFEGHMARYAPGGFYKPHLDQATGTQARQISVILYLNPEWQAEDGGELRIYTTPETLPVAGDPSQLVRPSAGTLVVFRSADFWHEVLVARRERNSLTGWFRLEDAGSGG